MMKKIFGIGCISAAVLLVLILAMSSSEANTDSKAVSGNSGHVSDVKYCKYLYPERNLFIDNLFSTQKIQCSDIDDCVNALLNSDDYRLEAGFEWELDQAQSYNLMSPEFDRYLDCE